MKVLCKVTCIVAVGACVVWMCPPARRVAHKYTSAFTQEYRSAQERITHQLMGQPPLSHTHPMV